MTLTAPEPGITRPTSWRLELPAGTFLLNDNQRLHFRTKAKHIETIRDASCLTARAARIPTSNAPTSTTSSTPSPASGDATPATGPPPPRPPSTDS
ncbi:hypothetical protein Srufu_079030 (plasmid) [Streptomyces libani subsp. rufus]|nr:hypothetical protein Srufu_079030 [Streptomyces libani subsp. rufus]